MKASINTTTGDPMTPARARRARWLVTALVALAEFSHLGWQWAHGGITRHHLFQSADLPAISNAWGALVLPLLAWVLSGAALGRCEDAKSRRAVFAAGLGALAAGTALSLAFLYANGTAPAAVMGALLFVALFLPVYRAEYLLGFILGMSLTFGPVIPILPATLLALVSVLAHYLLRPMLGWVGARFSR